MATTREENRDNNIFSFFEEATSLEVSSESLKKEEDLYDDIPILKQEESEEDTKLEEEEVEDKKKEVKVETKEESNEESDEDEDSELSPFNTFASILIEDGVLAPRLNEAGELIEDYEDSEEGLKKMVEHTIEDKVNTFKEELNSLVINNTVGATVGDLVKFIEDGGDPKEFFANLETVDLEDVDLDIVDNQKLLISQKLELEGAEKDEIEELLEEYELAGTLAKQAKLAHRVLIKNEQAEFERLKQQQEEQRQKELELEKKQAEEFKAKIFSLNQIGNIPVTEKEKAKFYDYITKPVKKTSKGELLTQYEIDSSDDKRLEMAFVLFKGGVGAIEKSAKTKNSLDLKMALSKSKDSMLRNSQSSESEQEEIKNKKESKIYVPDINW